MFLFPPIFLVFLHCRISHLIWHFWNSILPSNHRIDIHLKYMRHFFLTNLLHFRYKHRLHTKIQTKTELDMPTLLKLIPVNSRALLVISTKFFQTPKYKLHKNKFHNNTTSQTLSPNRLKKASLPESLVSFRSFNQLYPYLRLTVSTLSRLAYPLTGSFILSLNN